MIYLKNIFKYFYIILTPIISFSDPGDLVEYNFQNTFSISTLNIFLNSLGNNSTNVMYPISVYDIKYDDGDIEKFVPGYRIQKYVPRGTPVKNEMPATKDDQKKLKTKSITKDETTKNILDENNSQVREYIYIYI